MSEASDIRTKIEALLEFDPVLDLYSYLEQIRKLEALARHSALLIEAIERYEEHKNTIDWDYVLKCKEIFVFVVQRMGLK